MIWEIEGFDIGHNIKLNSISDNGYLVLGTSYQLCANNFESVFCF